MRLHALEDAKFVFKSYVFADEMFPACDFENPDKARELLGTYAIKTKFYDSSRKVVEAPKTPGAYAAIVEITPKEGRSLHRYATLYRVPEKVDASWKANAEDADALAKTFGLDVAVAKRQADVVATELKMHSFAEISHDARAARLLAGLQLAKSGSGAVHKYDDAFALERQFWVDLKRQLNGNAKEFTKKVETPVVFKGEAARVVHEGTLADAGMKSDTADKIDAVCKEWAANDDQAFAVCIVRHGVIVLHKAYGDRDGKPMTVTTKSWMASITKTMSASLMWMLIDQGLVGLDDPVDKYLPELRGIKVEQPLTIRHLYTHTNGLDKWPGWNDEMPDLEEHIAEYYRKLKVGKTWAYTGTGYELGGKVIEAVSGETVPIFFHNHLLGPLGCTDTDVIGTHADSFSVPLDIAKFGQLLLNSGAYGDKRFFREKTFEQMLPEKLTKVLGADAIKTFGVGLDGNRDKFGHGAASAATFSVDRTEDLVVVMTRNKQGKNQDKYNGKFWDALKAGIEKPAEKKPE